MEIQVGELRANVMKDACYGSANTVIEPFD
jgi:hypothetical protein